MAKVEGIKKGPEPAASGDELEERGLSSNPKQIRARMRRAAARGTRFDAHISTLPSMKPLEEWTEEELARGMPQEYWKRAQRKGTVPQWLPQALHEEMVRKYQEVVRGKLREATLPALTVLSGLIQNQKMDKRGRPIVPAAVKLNAAQFLIEHVIGKPTQKVEGDISVRLQALLANVMVTPEEAGRVAAGWQQEGDAAEASAALAYQAYAEGEAFDDLDDEEAV